MEQEYYQIFENIYGRNSRFFPDFRYPNDRIASRLRLAIESAIESTETLTKLRIRVDARVFLLINLYEMFLLPIALRRRSSADQSIDDAYEQLSKDLSTILSQAVSDSEAERSEEVTAGHILSAVDKVYRNLKLTGFNVWG